VYTTHYRVRFDPTFNSDFLELYKLKYLEHTICRIGGSRLTKVVANSTWTDSDNEIQCTLINFYNFQTECVEVSINRGRSYTSDCKSSWNTIRAPVIYSYDPKLTMLRQPLTITVKGRDFVNGQLYKCLFHPTQAASEYLRDLYLDNIITAIWDNSNQIRCHVPLSVQNASNSVYVSVFHGYMKLHTFKDPINYIGYLRLNSLSPIRGTKLGGT